MNVRPPGTSGKRSPGRSLLTRLERATLRLEAPVRRAVRSNRLNPLPHAGTISVFLLVVIVVTGVYLTLFYQFGFEASYEAVRRIESHPIQRVVRGVHRYASAALVMTTLVHGWRTFVMARFVGKRRNRWVTGVLALLVVWLAGVTGYWLIWDERAQALTEAWQRLIDGFDAGVDQILDFFIGEAAGTGWVVLLVIWFAHLLLTGLIGWALWYHLRRTHHRWFPPRHWMWWMIGALVVGAALLPAGMLSAADPTRLIGSMPLDPFIMFLLPPLLTASPWLVLGLGVVALALVLAVPWMFRRSEAGVVTVIDSACTGCELCVVDCPYEALTMGGDDDKLAIADPDRCVGCGICLGSCSFGALELPGIRWDPPDVSGRRVVIACDRHVRLGTVAAHDIVTIPVMCAGTLHASAAASLLQGGATAVQVVGCPAADCVYGLGNILLHERLSGERAPHIPRRWQGAVTEDWVAPTEVTDAVAHPGGHDQVGPDRIPAGWGRRIGAIVVVLASIGVIRLLTDAPYRPDIRYAEVVVALAHSPGRQLEGLDGPTGTAGEGATLALSIDDALVREVELQVERVDGAEEVQAFERVQTGPGLHRVAVALEESGSVSVLYDAPVDLPPGRRIIIERRDLPLADDVARGAGIFRDARPGVGAGCTICHSLEPGRRLVGPSLAGVGTRAQSRVPGVSAKEYLRQSIVDPDAYVVEGYPEGQMLSTFGEDLSPADIDALVAYLLTLTVGGSG